MGIIKDSKVLEDKFSETLMSVKSLRLTFPPELLFFLFETLLRPPKFFTSLVLLLTFIMQSAVPEFPSDIS